MKPHDALTCSNPVDPCTGHLKASRQTEHFKNKNNRAAKSGPFSILQRCVGRALRLGGPAHRIVGPVAVEPRDAPFDALAEAGKTAILDDGIMHVAQLAVTDHDVTRAVATRNIVGLPG